MKINKNLNYKLHKCADAIYQRELESAKRCIDACFDPCDLFVDNLGIRVPDFSKLKCVLVKIGTTVKVADCIHWDCFKDVYWDVCIQKKADYCYVIDNDDAAKNDVYSHLLNEGCSKYHANLFLEKAAYALDSAMSAGTPVAVDIISHYIKLQNLEKLADCADKALVDQYIKVRAEAKKVVCPDSYRKFFSTNFQYGSCSNTFIDYAERYKCIADSAFDEATLHTMAPVKYPPFRRYVVMMHKLYIMFWYDYTMLDGEGYEPGEYESKAIDLNERFAGVLYAMELAIAHGAYAIAMMIGKFWENAEVQFCLKTNRSKIDSLLFRRYHKIRNGLINRIKESNVGTEFDNLYKGEIKDKIASVQKWMAESPEMALYYIQNTECLIPIYWFSTRDNYCENVFYAEMYTPKDSDSHRMLSDFNETLDKLCFEQLHTKPALDIGWTEAK